MNVALAITAQLSARVLLARVGPRWTIAPGLLIAAAGAFLLTRLDVTSDYVNLILPATMIFGAGLGLTISAAINTATAGVEPADAGVASAMVNVGQQVGGSIGTSLLNTVAAAAAASYAGSPLLAALHGYRVGFTWSGTILLTTAVLAVLLLHRRPAPAPVVAAPPVRTEALCPSC